MQHIKQIQLRAKIDEPQRGDIFVEIYNISILSSVGAPSN